MAMDRQGTGLAILRVFTGVFFLFLGIEKLGWLLDSSTLAHRLSDWLNAAPPGSTSQWYLQTIALPGVAVFSRLVPLGEIGCGAALIVGFWTPFVASIAFFLAVNYHVAGGTLFRYAFLTNGYGLPVLGATLALAIGGVRLRWSVR